jgi:site-specific DNA-methyltransferase (adenine-specific)
VKAAKESNVSYERDESLESHAYAFIHTDDVNARVNEIFGGEMKFDVIIGNPPYQLNDGGNQASAKPIYQLFIEQAKKLEPRFLTMVVPARWYSGGKGLSDFRNQMLGDDRLRELCDFFDANLVFPGIDISGGVCYFLWNLNERGPCKITTHLSSGASTLERPLLQDGKDTFIRFNQAVSIVEKVHAKQLNRFSDLISSRKPFGIPTNVDVSQEQKESQIRIFAYPNNGFVDEDKITNNFDWVEKYKVMIAYAYGERGSFPYMVTGKPFIGGQGTCCSETYIITAVTDSLSEANNVITYMSTRFFRFLVLLKKNTQHATSKVYELVPVQDFSKPWTDEELYKKYGLDQDEIGFIESMIRPMSPSHHV